VGVTSPSAFLCYRRADEPFAAALLGVALGERFGPAQVFLDTVSLRSRRQFERELIERARTSRFLLVVIGRRWDVGRLAEADDWVRRELLEAHRSGARIVPVLVERETMPEHLPRELAFLAEHGRVRLGRPHVPADIQRIADLVAGSAPAADRPVAGFDVETVRRAALAMVRHVLPGPQQSMRNDAMIADVVAEQLAPDEWLRFAGAGRSGPRRPRGSAIVMQTDDELRLVEVDEDLRGFHVERRPLGPDTELRRVDSHLLWRETADVHVNVPGPPPLAVLGMFREPAKVLCAAARGPDHR
jgi:hypothetical protein